MKPAPIYAAVVLIAAGLAVKVWHDSAERQTAASQGAAAPTPNAVALKAMPPQATSSVPSVPVAAAPVAAPRTASQIYATSLDYARDYQTLVNSPEPAASFYAAELLGACIAISDPTTGGFAEFSAEDAKRLSAMTDRSLDARRSLISRCSGWTGKLPPGNELGELRRRAALANAPIGKAALLPAMLNSGMTDEANAIVSEVFRKQDGYAFQYLATAVNGPEGWKVGETTVPPELVDPVLNLASCEFGRDCKSETTELVFQCATIGFCPRNLRDAVLYSVDGDQRQQIERDSALVVDAIRNGRLDLLGLSRR